MIERKKNSVFRPHFDSFRVSRAKVSCSSLSGLLTTSEKISSPLLPSATKVLLPHAIFNRAAHGEPFLESPRLRAAQMGAILRYLAELALPISPSYHT